MRPQEQTTHNLERRLIAGSAHQFLGCRHSKATTSKSSASDVLKSFSSGPLTALAAVSFESDVAVWLGREDLEVRHSSRQTTLAMRFFLLVAVILRLVLAPY